MKITCNIQKVCEFYDKFPIYKGKIFVETPYGPKRILEAKKVESNSIAYSIKTKNYSLVCSPYHRIDSNKNWSYVKDITIGQNITTKSGNQKVIESKYIDEKKDLYDIQVEDVQQYYSNGILSHNSSFLEAITFGLFGRTNRSINKDKIINWKNRKECEVTVSFKIGKENFVVKRGIKPDFLEIWKNGKIIMQPPDVRQYQKILENDILKIDYHLFCTLVYINLNNYTPFLQMDSTRKRAFVEKMFGLEMFSELNKQANEKLSLIENKLNVHNTEKSIKDNFRQDLQKRTHGLILQRNGIKSSEPELVLVNEKISFIKNPEQTFNKRSEKVIKVTSECTALEGRVLDITNSIKLLNEQEEILKNQIDKKKKDIAKLKDDKKNYEKVLSKYSNISSKIEKKQEEKTKIKDQIQKLVDKIHSEEIEVSNLQLRKNEKSDRIKTLEGKAECPLCLNPIDDPEYIPKITQEIEKLSTEVTTLQELITYGNDLLKKRNITLTSTNEEIEGLNKDKRKYDEAELHHKNIDAVIEAIDLESDKEKLSEMVKKIKDLNGDLVKVNEKLLKVNEAKKALSEKYEAAKKDYDTYKDLLKEKASLEEKVVWENNTKSDLDTQIKENNEKLNELEKECAELETACKKLSTLTDYMNYIKVVCRDENAKQYAISFLMPFLTKQINHYLAKAEINYYLNLTNIMEEEIKGPGIYNASYGNLSGGESKSIDLSILFALLDISRLQLGIFPDIILLDEILDTSIDKTGLDSILKIIHQRQKNDNSSIWIVTHRSDVSELNGMKVYNVEKVSGFSTITEVNE